MTGVSSVHADVDPKVFLQDSGFGTSVAERTFAFHRSIPGYAPTPLASLSCLAAELGVAGIYVKDESKRLGLNAFKVLGGSHCVARHLAGELGIDPEGLTFDALMTPEAKAVAARTTFVTATDGNHGRGVAWSASAFGAKSVVYMPWGSAQERVDNIRAAGAHVEVTDLNYDDTVGHAKAQAERCGWVLVQDTSWDGYEEVPRRIMEGYCTLGAEMAEQLGDVVPTHVFLQAGVGSMAGALAAYLGERYAAAPPKFVLVEPTQANCHYLTAQAADGSLHAVRGHMRSIMAGLCCGIPCTLSWEVLQGRVSEFVSMPDEVAARGMRVLGAPLGEDPRIVSGESGASGFGLAYELLANPELAWLRDRLGIDGGSRLLCVSTEGATDVANYRRIVWDGAWPSGV